MATIHICDKCKTPIPSVWFAEIRGMGLIWSADLCTSCKDLVKAFIGKEEACLN